jgi:hypothetical protein
MKSVFTFKRQVKLFLFMRRDSGRTSLEKQSTRIQTTPGVETTRQLRRCLTLAKSDDNTLLTCQGDLELRCRELRVCVKDMSS